MRCCILLLLLLTSLAIGQNDTIVISTGNKEDVDVQIVTEILREAYYRIGITIVVKHFPWARALEKSNTGLVDGELFRVEGKQKKFTNLLPVEPAVHSTDFVGFSKDSTIKINGWQSLKPYRIGYMLGVQHIEENIKGMNSVALKEFKQGLAMIEYDRIDLFIIGGDYTFYRLLSESDVKDLFRLDPPIEQVPLYHYVHQKNRRVIAPLSKVLDTMYNSGRIKEIRDSVMQNYFIKTSE